jgi:hypothetical protein
MDFDPKNNWRVREKLKRGKMQAVNSQILGFLHQCLQIAFGAAKTFHLSL